MDKAIKQRLLGAVVLVAGAALFLPLLFDGSGAGLPAREEIPAKPRTPTVDELAPKLDKQAAALAKSVEDTHAGQTFYPVDAPPPVVKDEPAPTAADESFEMVQPAKPVEPDSSAQATLAAAAAEKARQEKLASAKAAQDKLALEKKAQQDKQLAQERDARAKADAAEQARKAQEKLEQEKRLAAEKAKADAASKAAAAESLVPEAWVVQVASLSARDKADDLAGRLRKKGYRAMVHGGEGAWKVSVGPELRKEVATTIKQKLAADPDLKLSGFLVAYKP